MIDQAIYSAITEKKPVYLEIPCNLACFKVPEPTPYNFTLNKTSDPEALTAAVDDILAHIKASVKPILIGGVKLRKTNSSYEFEQLADKLQTAVALMPDAKSLFSENHPLYIGRYWPSVSSPMVSEVVESSDLFLFAGPIFNDYTTTGWTALIAPSKLINIQADHVVVCGSIYNNVLMPELLLALADKVPVKPIALQTYQRLMADYSPPPSTPPDDVNAPLSLHEIRRQVQGQLTPETDLVIETGDSWFIGQGFKIPDGLKYHVQMQYGSIGWSVGAVLGAALGAQESGRKVLALIGDGSFQLTCQEISTIIRQGVQATIILLNNDGYTIEVEIHDGPYNDIQGWDYAKLIEVFNGRDGNGVGVKARTSQELTDALIAANTHDGLTFIECFLSRDDCTKELLLWGSHVATANGRGPST
jgi:pyruvate decarboxylase